MMGSLSLLLFGVFAFLALCVSLKKEKEEEERNPNCGYTLTGEFSRTIYIIY
jgi:hypothetical protein